MSRYREPHFGEPGEIPEEPAHRPTVVHTPPPHRRRGGLGLGWLLILFLLATTGASGYYSYTLFIERNALEAELAKERKAVRDESRQTEGQAAKVVRLEKQLRAVQRDRRGAQKKLAAIAKSSKKTAGQSVAQITVLEKQLAAAVAARNNALKVRDAALGAKRELEKSLKQLARADAEDNAGFEELEKALQAAEDKAKRLTAERDQARAAVSKAEARIAKATAGAEQARKTAEAATKARKSAEEAAASAKRAAKARASAPRPVIKPAAERAAAPAPKAPTPKAPPASEIDAVLRAVDELRETNQ